MAENVYRAAKRLNLKLNFAWKPKEVPIIQTADMSSIGPWLDFDDSP